jgi:hypothetical protein
LPDDLVRKIRFDVTQWNLERIQRLAETIARREEGVGEFLQMPERLWEEVLSLRAAANKLIESADDDFRGDLDAFREGLRELRDEIESLLTTLRREKATAGALQAQLFDSLSERPDVKLYLVRAAGEVGRRLTRENYWTERGSCDSLFSEYVELLRGVALRSARFGDEDLSIGDLFLIADGLPSVWGPIEGWRWQSLAVPSRLDQSSSTEAMVLRVGFPEWTIWALPLLQHEFGHIVVKRMKLDPSGAESAVLADALAVLVVGPAYACATLLLRLDPAAVDYASEVALRSATIINALRAVAKDAGLEPVTRLVQRLEDEWRVAVKDARGSVGALDEALKSSDWQTALATGRSAIPGLANGGGSSQPRWVEKWATVSAWADQLRQGNADEMDLAAVDGKDEERPSLNLVLNAAWLARVRPDPKDDADAVQVETIGKTAVTRMLEYIRAPLLSAKKPTGVRG